jgi:ATPase family associated with various cellular activities (AAA)
METFDPTMWSERCIKLHANRSSSAHPGYWVGEHLTIVPHERWKYSESFLARVEGDTDWNLKPGQEWPSVAPEDRKLIGTEQKDCIVCGGRRERPSIWVGKDTGIELYDVRSCPCVFWRRYHGNWSKSVPKRYRDVLWSTLAPCEAPNVRLSIERQKEIIQFIQTNPDDSYLLFGESGAGKTHISIALHEYHLRKWALNPAPGPGSGIYCPVMRANVATLLAEHHRVSLSKPGDGTPRASIDVARIKAIIEQGDRPVLILDELDKLGGKATDFRMESVFTLVDLVYQEKGVVIATSNHHAEWFIQTWGKENGESVIRRLGGEEQAHSIRFEDRPVDPQTA